MMGPGATLSWSGDSMGFKAVGKPGAQASIQPRPQQAAGAGEVSEAGPCSIFL